MEPAVRGGGGEGRGDGRGGGGAWAVDAAAEAVGRATAATRLPAMRATRARGVRRNIFTVSAEHKQGALTRVSNNSNARQISSHKARGV